jgi:hypothetical protein
MKLEIQTDPDEWITVHLWGEGTAVSMAREAIIYDGTRRVDPDAGLCFDVKHLPALIEALQKVQASVPSSVEPKK